MFKHYVCVWINRFQYVRINILKKKNNEQRFEVNAFIVIAHCKWYKYHSKTCIHWFFGVTNFVRSLFFSFSWKVYWILWRVLHQDVVIEVDNIFVIEKISIFEELCLKFCLKFSAIGLGMGGSIGCRLKKFENCSLPPNLKLLSKFLWGN